MLGAIPLLFVVSLVFYLIAAVEYELFLKQDEEVTMLSKTLNKIIDKKQKCTNEDGEEEECPQTNSTSGSRKSLIDGSSLEQI